MTGGDRRSRYQTVCIPKSLFSVPRQSNRLRLQERSNFRMADLSDAMPPPLPGDCSQCGKSNMPLTERWGDAFPGQEDPSGALF